MPKFWFKAGSGAAVRGHTPKHPWNFVVGVSAKDEAEAREKAAARLAARGAPKDWPLVFIGERGK